MRISLSGAQCTGKTTLMSQIENAPELFEKFTLIKEVVRTIKEREGDNFEFNKSGDFKSQEMILAEHHRNVLRHNCFITDRGAFDAFAYATKNYMDGKFTFREWKIFETIFGSTQSKYDVTFYLPIGMIPMEDDSVRDTDIEYQKQMHEIYMWIAAEYGIELIILNDPLDERFEVFKGILFPHASCCENGDCK